MKMNLQLIDDNGISTIEVEILLNKGTVFAHEFGIYKITESDPEIYHSERIKNFKYSALFFKLSNDITQTVLLNDLGSIEILNYNDCSFEIIESIDYDRFNINIVDNKLVIS